MIGWFTWNNSRSDAMGLWVSKLPPIIRPEERNEKVEIPGRSGSLIMLQGQDVFKSYVKECSVVCRRNLANIQDIIRWLRGSGIAVFGNEPNKAYKARILSKVQFEKVDNNLMEAVIPFYVDPFKISLHPENDIVQSSADSFTVANPGDVASRPVVTITNDGNAVDLTLSFGNQTMVFSQLTGTIVVDCGAEIITKNNDIYTGSVSGEFWELPKGETTVTKNANVSVTVEPNWRWL